MAILHRIEEIRAVEHTKLRQAMARVDTRLRELEEEERHPKAQPRPRDMFGDPIPSVGAPKLRVVVVTPLIRAWRPFEDAALSRLDRWEEHLWPLVRRWTAGEIVGVEIQQVASELLASRDTTERHLREVRRHAMFVEEISPLMVAVYAALTLCDRAEQAEVIPALLSGSRETADRAERTVTADDVARNLRASILSDEGEFDDDDPAAQSTPWGRLWNRISGY